MNEGTYEIEHTQQCLAQRVWERDKHDEYEVRWPGYCRKCGGEGGRSDYEYRGECHGVPASEQVYTPCSDCIEQLKCPRCSVEGENNFQLIAVIDGEIKPHCYACGWTEGMPGCPEIVNPYDCGCEMP